jgi:hypothetical protein
MVAEKIEAALSLQTLAFSGGLGTTPQGAARKSSRITGAGPRWSIISRVLGLRCELDRLVQAPRTRHINRQRVLRRRSQDTVDGGVGGVGRNVVSEEDPDPDSASGGSSVADFTRLHTGGVLFLEKWYLLASRSYG